MFIVFICCVEFYILFGNFSCDSGKLRFFSAACRFLVFDLEMWRVSGKNLTMILQKTQKYMFNTHAFLRRMVVRYGNTRAFPCRFGPTLCKLDENSYIYKDVETHFLHIGVCNPCGNICSCSHASMEIVLHLSRKEVLPWKQQVSLQQKQLVCAYLHFISCFSLNFQV